METVAFYSYKGGVGRTLLVANTAEFLALSGRRVVVLDLDLEAPGLHHKLGRPGIVRGAVAELLDAIEGERPTRSLRETAIEVDLPVIAGGSLHFIPAGAAPSPQYWATLERLNNALRSARRNGGLPEALLELQARIAAEFQPEFLLIDSRTGITELGGLATSLLADRVVCMTTTAPESVEGTLVVAEALRSAPRLSSQKKLRIDYLITRVPNEVVPPANVIPAVERLGGSVRILPHDPGIAREERVYSTSRPYQPGDNADAKKGLLFATLQWIAESFPGQRQDAERAGRRMAAVHRAWLDLTQSTVRGDPWPAEHLRERVRFGDRQADIVAYDRSQEEIGARPLMIIEYVEGEDTDAVAQWWISHYQPRVVALLSDASAPRLYSSTRPVPSDRQDLPLPHDFKALSDPTDASIDSMLDAVRRGYQEYIFRIVSEWLLIQAAGAFEDAAWKSDVAKRIVDGLAKVDDVLTAERALQSSTGNSLSSLGWRKLSTPLLWRLPPEASVPFTRDSRAQIGRLAGRAAIMQLAEDVLGLHYEPNPEISFEISPAPATNLGNYHPQSAKVILYSPAITQCAELLDLRARHLGSVTLIHETLHALLHRGRDLDGHMWTEFAPSEPLTALLQYFTYQQLLKLEDPDLLNAFEVLSSKQAPPYRSWRRLRDLPLEDARSWLMRIRRGAGLATPTSDLLTRAIQDET